MADYSKIVSPEEPALSPDGRTVAVVVRRAKLEDDTYETDLTLVDTASGASRQVTFDRKEVSAPAWSPQGDRLAFLAQHGEEKDAHAQVFELSLAGGDARQVTSAPEGVAQFAWRPDGRALAYVAEDERPKKTGADKFKDAFEVAGDGYLTRDAAHPNHLFLIAASGGTPRALTSGVSSVAAGEAQSTLSWSADGKTLAFVQVPSAILDEASRSRVMLLDVASGAQRPLTQHTAHEALPLFSPDGSRIAYQYAPGDSQVNLVGAYVAQQDGSAARNVAQPLDRTVLDMAWEPRGASLLLAVNDGTQHRIFAAPLGGRPHPLPLGDVAPSSSLAGAVARDGTLAFVGSTPQQPGEVYLLHPGATAPRQLTNYNAPLAARGLPRREALEYAGPGGFHEDAIVTYPPGFSPAQRYPLVLLIHGGPTSASLLDFSPLAALLASRGWLVLQPNYRGSDNHGYAYQHAVYEDAQAGPGRDVMAALAALQARGNVDSARIGVSGWSYGGIMTSWLVVKYHVWRAALSGAAVNDWIADYSTADDATADREVFRGSPFVGDNRSDWLQQSTVNYAKDVTTPLLIVHDVGDARDPIVSSYEFYRALRDNGKPVTFVAYPISGHFPSDPVRIADLYGRWIDWFDGHFKESAVPAR